MTILLNSHRFGIPGPPAQTDQFGALAATHLPAYWWRLNDASGAVAVDLSGNGRNGGHQGATPGSASLHEDGFGLSTDYDGTNDWTERAAEAAMQALDFTVIAIARADSVSGHRMIAARDNAAGSTTNRHWCIRQNGTIATYGYWDAVVSSSTGDRNPGLPAIATGKNNLYALVVENSGLRHRSFMNAVEGTAYTLTTAKSHATAQPMELGRYKNPGGGDGFYFDGRIQDFLYIPTALTRKQIFALAAAHRTESGDSVLFHDIFETGAIGAGWTRHGVTSGDESSVNGGMQSVIGSGEFYTRSLPAGISPTDNFEVEVQVDPNTNAVMGGPVILEASALSGQGATQYSSPNQCLITNITTGTYGGAFQSAGGPMDPHRLRIRKIGTSYYAAQSADGGVTWVETIAQVSAFTVGRIGFGSWLNGYTGIFTDFVVRKI